MAPFTRNASLLMLLLHQKKSKIVKPNRQTDENIRVRKMLIDRKIKVEFHLSIANLKLHDHDYLKKFPNESNKI